MRGLGLRLLILLVTFSVGIFSTRLANLFSQPVGAVDPVFVGAVLVPHRPGFSFVEESCESGCHQTYETSDGRQVFFILACHSGSPAEAQRSMQTLIELGTIVHRGWQKDSRGSNERVVVVNPKNDVGEHPVIIFSYHRGDICFEYIEAGSLELALEFERSGTKDAW